MSLGILFYTERSSDRLDIVITRRALVMESTLTVRVANRSDLEDLAKLFDQYRQFYHCAPDLPAARNWLEENIDQERSIIL